MFKHHSKKYKKIYFIDVENVGFQIPNKIEEESYYYYFCDDRLKTDFKNVKNILSHDNISIFTHESSKIKKNSLDFCIVVELAKYVSQYRGKKEYYIVSKDKGYIDAVEMLNQSYNALIHCIYRLDNNNLLTDYRNQSDLIKRIESIMDLKTFSHLKNEAELLQTLGKETYDNLTILRHNKIRSKDVHLRWSVFDKCFILLVDNKLSGKFTNYQKAIQTFTNACNNLEVYFNGKLKRKAIELSICNDVEESYQKKINLSDVLISRLGFEEGMRVFNEFVCC